MRFHHLTQLAYIPVFCLVLNGCATTAPTSDDHDVEFAVATVAKAAQYIQSTDWIGYSEELETAFTENELEFLELHKDAISPLIASQLSGDHSVYGAKLTGRFKLVELLRYLRFRLIDPKSPYGWEGTDSNDVNQMASGHQFQHHSAYVEAIKEMTGAPLAESLTPEDIEKINQFKDDEDNLYYHWSIWLLRELGDDVP